MLVCTPQLWWGGRAGWRCTGMVLYTAKLSVFVPSDHIYERQTKVHFKLESVAEVNCWGQPDIGALYTHDFSGILWFKKAMQVIRMWHRMWSSHLVHLLVPDKHSSPKGWSGDIHYWEDEIKREAVTQGGVWMYKELPCPIMWPYSSYSSAALLSLHFSFLGALPPSTCGPWVKWGTPAAQGIVQQQTRLDQHSHPWGFMYQGICETCVVGGSCGGLPGGWRNASSTNRMNAVPQEECLGFLFFSFWNALAKRLLQSEHHIPLQSINH